MAGQRAMAPRTTTVVIPYLRVAAHLAAPDARSVAAVRAATRPLVPTWLRGVLAGISGLEIADAVRHRVANALSYRALCGVLLRVILLRDGWQLRPALRRGVRRAKRAPARPIFVAQQGRRRISFYFLDQSGPALTRALRAVVRRDAGAFRELAVLLVRTSADLDRVRAARQADQFPRALFVSFPELRAVAALVAPAEYRAIAGPVTESGLDGEAESSPGSVAAFDALITANKTVGGSGRDYYILTFQTPQMREVWPSQFVMMDVSPQRQFLRPRLVRRGRLSGGLDLAPRPVLKRPFAIQRTYYRHFDRGFLQHLRLPPSLALALHPVHPHRFDLLYRVLPAGVGTALMTRLRRGQRVNMLGPLGRPFDVRSLRVRGVAEVHVIGGGVGMAPLILLVHQLRYYSVPVKVFIGISKLQSLRYRGDVDQSFAEEPGNAYVYVDDLLEAGVPRTDIYLSCDSERPTRGVRRIPRRNLYHGLITDQYQQCLADHPRPPRDRTLAIACGPDRMMEIIWDITRAAGLPLRVLIEKRMACGIGVCLSCVCRVRRPDGSEDYSRVCTEGPVFDASELLWNPNDSKSASAACDSVRPC